MNNGAGARTFLRGRRTLDGFGEIQPQREPTLLSFWIARVAFNTTNLGSSRVTLVSNQGIGAPNECGARINPSTIEWLV
jgi:hypothetical protein